MIPVNALLLEDNRADAMIIQRRLAQARQFHFTVDHVERLSTAVTALRNRTYDIVYIDLTLPDSNGVETVIAIKRVAPNTPVIVLSGREDLETATNSVRAGAQSFIVKRVELTTDELERDTLYAIERARTEYTSKELLRQSVRRMSTRDGESLPAGSSLVLEHIDRLDESIGEVRAFLQKNYPTASDGVDSILEHKATFITLRELRSLLGLEAEQSSRNTTKVTARAMKVVQGSSDPVASREMTPSEADEALLKLVSDEP